VGSGMCIRDRVGLGVEALSVLTKSV